MISETTLMAMKYKLVLASALVAGTAIAEATMPTDAPPWEAWSLKGLLIAAIIYLVRELSLERANNKAESDRREDRMIAAIEKMAEGHDKVVQAVGEQTEFYRQIAKSAVERLMHQGQQP
jgi:hypothetical protein